MKNLKFIVVMLIGITVFNLNAQELSVIKTSIANINELPEYVIVTSENTKLLGGIAITIDAKKSKYKNQLRGLEEILQDGDKLNIRNQTDLLNAMSQLGYEYLSAYNAETFTSGGEYGYEHSKQRINMVFRKREKFRNQ